jgi:hypothetical protein
MSRYRAFISYRQVDSDRKIAVWLHRSLEAYRTPRGLVKTGTRPRAGTIFRDEEELYASSNLPETIRSALRESDYLVVVCSPRSAASKWVNAEIKYFRDKLTLPDSVLSEIASEGGFNPRYPKPKIRWSM